MAGVVPIHDRAQVATVAMAVSVVAAGQPPLEVMVAMADPEAGVAATPSAAPRPRVGMVAFLAVAAAGFEVARELPV